MIVRDSAASVFTSQRASAAASLDDTLAACRALERQAGITRVADISGLDEIGLNVVSVVRPNSRALSIASGKGATLAEAQVSGLMEGLEIFHAEIFSDQVPFSDLPGGCIVPDLSALPRAANARRLTGPWPSLAMTVGCELISGSVAAVPFGLVHTDFRVETERSNDGYIISSNGLGGGADMTEAVLHGLCEVIEGDAVAVFHASQKDRFARIDWSTVDDADALIFRSNCLSFGVDVIAWDITTEIGVPCFYCRLVERGNGPLNIAIATDGAGCHPIPAIALKGALFEAIQTRALLISGARDDLRPRHYCSTAPLPFGSSEVPLVEVACAGRSSAEMLVWLLDRLTAAGFAQAIAVDLKSRSPQLAFARVVVPGLDTFPYARHYSPGKRARSAGAWR